MACSVIIVTYRTGPALWMCIDSVLKQEECGEVIIVDNGNPPDVRRRLQDLAREQSRLRVIEGQGNIGFAKACNKGAAIATQEYFLLLNPDCLLPKEALRKMREALEAEDAMLAGCFLMNPDGTEQRGSRRNLATPQTVWQEFSRPFRRGKNNGPVVNLHDTPAPGGTTAVEAISGAFMFLRRADYIKLEGMDERYFLHMEDMDFCKRVQLAGGRTVWVPEVKVLHLRSTSDASLVKLEWCKTKGFLRYFRTHYLGPHMPLLQAAILARFIAKAAQAFLYDIFQKPLQNKLANNRLLWLMRNAREADSQKEHDIRVLVTGASSQVGIACVAELLNSGVQVIALTHRTDIPFAHPRLRWVKGDLADEHWALEDIKPDAVIHAAAIWLLPAVLPRMIEAGAKRIVAFSSMSAVSKAESKNSYERDVAEKLLAAENKTLEISTEKQAATTILRPTMIYGIGLDRNVMRIANVITKLKRFPLYGQGIGQRQPVHAQDLARAALQCVTSPLTYGKTYEVGGGSRISYREMVTRVFDALGLPPRFFHIPYLPQIATVIGYAYQLRYLNSEMVLRTERDLVCDTSMAEADFGYAARPFLITSDML
jgi:GT2 family glycosyltransferase/nucleoside-diphosphate-sugar epimerase